MEFKITPARADDAGAVSAVLRASYPDLLEPFYDADILQAALRHFGTHREWNGRSIGRRIYAACEAGSTSLKSGPA